MDTFEKYKNDINTIINNASTSLNISEPKISFQDSSILGEHYASYSPELDILFVKDNSTNIDETLLLFFFILLQLRRKQQFEYKKDDIIDAYAFAALFFVKYTGYDPEKIIEKYQYDNIGSIYLQIEFIKREFN